MPSLDEDEHQRSAADLLTSGVGRHDRCLIDVPPKSELLAEDDGWADDWPEDANAENTRLIESNGVDEFGSISPAVPSQEEIPYPKSVFYIVVTEACERFSYYGMKAILTFYLKFRLLFSEDEATVIYHAWSMLCYFTPIMGSLIADLALGRYRTILYLSVVYLFGNLTLSLSAFTPIAPTLPRQVGTAMFGLVLIAIGTGGIKPCVSAFGGDQFVLPQQARELAAFFSIFYFSINLGSLLSTVISPLLREHTTCFNDQCYFAAFGFPAILMGVALMVFLSGTPLYKKVPASGTILTTTASCIWLGASGKLKALTGKVPSRMHWLDHARGRHGDAIVEDVRVFTSILVLYLPLPLFWALYNQQGSRWVFQAAKMDGKVGAITIQPDQMQVINPLLIMLLVPLMEKYGYDLLAKAGWLRKPLQRVVAGGVIAACAFAVAAILQAKMEYNDSMGLERINVLWQVPQYVLITLGEVFFSVSGLQFSFTEAPVSMRSVVQAAWLLTTAVGDLMVVWVAHSAKLSSQTYEFTLFSCLMLLDMIIFAVLAHFYSPYRPVPHAGTAQPSSESDDETLALHGPRLSTPFQPLDHDSVVLPDDDPTSYALDDEETSVYDSTRPPPVRPQYEALNGA
ncbi:solute carrier family 15 member 2 isoform X2 [Hyalella azteca]|uniref:Oligopeptide transporter 1 n=1 Tax=Hyalella azteca TaxID=294128 RepID=A0A8B7NU50_HYAAZ|nr:solute carrier family 15 member 2 isoform X2 [Hyalella azteca]